MMNYKEAIQKAEENKGISYKYDAGQGWTGYATWNERNRRVVIVSINPEGIQI